TAKYKFNAATPPGKTTEGDLPKDWVSHYENGYLTLQIMMKSIASDFDLKAKLDPDNPNSKVLGELQCQPKSMCGWNKNSNKCVSPINARTSPLWAACHEKNAANEDAVCSFSVADLDCPAKGCPALQITFANKYAPDDDPDHHRPPTALFSSAEVKKDFDVGL